MLLPACAVIGIGLLGDLVIRSAASDNKKANDESDSLNNELRRVSQTHMLLCSESNGLCLEANMPSIMRKLSQTKGRMPK